MKMYRRQATEVNAGSMADIAFLLLIFFLVTTTMEADKGILDLLPVPDENAPPPAPVPTRNVLEITANAQNELLIESEMATTADVQRAVIAFYTNPQQSENLPEHRLVQFSEARDKVASIERKIEQGEPAVGVLEKELKKAQHQLTTTELVGSYKELPQSAIVLLKHDPKTSYQHYLLMQREATAALNHLRDSFCVANFNKPYDDLSETDEQERNMIIAARTVFPRRILEAKNMNP